MEETIQVGDSKVAVTESKKEVAIISTIREIKITSDPSFERAKEQMQLIRSAKKNIKERKDSVVGPLKTALDNFKAMFEPMEKEVAEVEVYLKGEMDSYVMKLKREADARAKEAEDRIKAGESMSAATKKVTNTLEKLEKIPIRKYWWLKIVDFSKVPDEFKELNESKALKAAAAGIKVEGLEFYQEEKTINAF